MEIAAAMMSDHQTRKQTFFFSPFFFCISRKNWIVFLASCELKFVKKKWVGERIRVNSYLTVPLPAGRKLKDGAVNVEILALMNRS